MSKLDSITTMFALCDYKIEFFIGLQIVDNLEKITLKCNIKGKHNYTLLFFFNKNGTFYYNDLNLENHTFYGACLDGYKDLYVKTNNYNDIFTILQSRI